MTSIPILWKRDRWDDHLGKLSEEFVKLCHELHDMQNGEGDLNKLTSEAMDVIQVAIGIIEMSGQSWSAVINKHTDKLLDRGWSIKGWIEVDVMMGVNDER